MLRKRSRLSKIGISNIATRVWWRTNRLIKNPFWRPITLQAMGGYRSVNAEERRKSITKRNVKRTTVLFDYQK
jgi:hypothetical protein